MAEARKTRAQLIQDARKKVEAQRRQTNNSGTGLSFLDNKHSSATGRLKK